LIDEGGFLMAPLVRRSLAPRGQTPVYAVAAAHRQKVSTIAALTLSPVRHHAGLYFQTHPNAYINQEKAAAFLEELLRHLRGKVIVIWDRGPMHRGPAIRAVLARYPRLSLEALPAYAPDLNPVEMLWNHLKYADLANFVPQGLWHLHSAVQTGLEIVQEDQERLHSFFAASGLPFTEEVTLVS
jgi:transposase